MKRETAEKILNATAEMEALLARIELASGEIEDEAEIKPVRDGVAWIYLTLYEDIARYAVLQFPELRPSSPHSLARATNPDTSFDDALLAQVRPDWLKAARIVGTVQVDIGKDNRPIPSAEFLAGRLQALANAGRIEVRGDLSQIRFSEVRLRDA